MRMEEHRLPKCIFKSQWNANVKCQTLWFRKLSLILKELDLNIEYVKLSIYTMSKNYCLKSIKLIGEVKSNISQS